MAQSTWNNAIWSVDTWLILVTGDDVPAGLISNTILDISTRKRIEIKLPTRQTEIQEYEVKKQLSEVIPLNFEVRGFLGGIEQIETLEIKCYNSEAEDITNNIISSYNYDEYNIIVNTKASSAVDCKLTVKITTNEGNVYEQDFKIIIVDKVDVERIQKQPSETLPVKVDFIRLLNNTEQLESALFYAKDSLGNTRTLNVVDRYSVEKNILKLILKAGIDGIVYNIYIRALTDEGNTYNKQIELTIVEK